jgi:signal transduction histidine kinase
MISSADILKGSILIVDDEQADVSLLEKMLRGAGYVSISSTRNPHEVCEMHRKNRYSLILLDLVMPGLDGFQVMEGLKEIEADGYLSVLVITAHPDQKLRALRAGAKDFASKPFDFAEVLLRVHNLLEVRLLHLEAATRREQAEGRFIEAQKMEVVGQLAGGVAHDFNNLLAVIMGYSELTIQKFGDNKEIRSNLETVRSTAERAAGLTRQLLIFSRKQTIQLSVLALNVVVQELETMLRRLIDENIELTFTPGKEIGRIKADPGYVGQVLMNLVVNARDAMPNGGKITVATSNATLDENHERAHPGAIPGDYVMLSVSDTGTGMTDEVKAHLFEAFFTTKPKGKGTGLGLATCQTIVQQSGGHICVYSEVGKGATFKVYFPRVEQPLDVPAGPIQTGPLPRGTETLLIVEDEPALRHLARDVLEAQGYEVLRAANGQHALHVAREHKGSPIRLVISDVIMPQMGGKVMAEWLNSAYPGLKILFTSGYTDDAIAHHGVLDASMAFLPKPYTPETLTRKVRELLDAAPATAHSGPAEGERTS